MLKELADGILSVVRFVVSILIETIIELRWPVLITALFFALVWIWLQSPYRPHARIYLMDPAPDRTWR